MRPLNLLFLVALAQLSALSMTIPITPDNESSIAARSQYCTNAPTTVAGTMLTRRTGAFVSETDTQVWCGLGSRTFIMVRVVSAIPGPAVYSVLENAYDAILNVINTVGDGVIRSGSYRYVSQGLELYTENTNNHQQTWGVLGAAVSALQQYMESVEWNQGDPASVQFSIYDGANEVAMGTLGPS